jgi:hypothetical protein
VSEPQVTAGSVGTPGGQLPFENTGVYPPRSAALGGARYAVGAGFASGLPPDEQAAASTPVASAAVASSEGAIPVLRTAAIRRPEVARLTDSHEIID